MQDNNVKNKLSALEIVIGIVNIIAAVGFFALEVQFVSEILLSGENAWSNIGMLVICCFTFPAVVLISPVWVLVFLKKRLSVFSICTYGIMAWLWALSGILGWFL